MAFFYPDTARHIRRIILAGLLITTAAFLSLWIALLCSQRPPLLEDINFSALYTDKDGRPLRLTLTDDEKYRLFTPLNRLPAEMLEAVMLYEDQYFFSHPGVNPLSLARSAVHMLSGGRVMGGSTITMQLARLTEKLNTTTLTGKLYQMWRAMVIEWHYTKHDILEAYLNVTPYGANIEGVGAAARIYFHKSPEQLSLPEILALVPVPQHPAARNPLAARDRTLSEARARMHTLWAEKHDGESLDFARLPLEIHSPGEFPREAQHAINSLIQEEDTSLRSGIIRTTLSLPLQRLLEQAVKQSVARGRRWGMDNAAALLLDWRSGEIRALVGSADFDNADIQGQVDGTSARRSPGSTLKPFIYALALEQGLIHPRTVLADTPRTFRGYEPENADGAFRGPVSATDALRASRNIPAVSLAGQLAPPGLYGFLRENGVKLTNSAEHYGLALVLGGAEVSMREIAALYAILPNYGLWRPASLRPVTSPARQALTPEAAFITMDMLSAPPPGGLDRRPLPWKTGTSNGKRDAWTAGICGPFVLVVWVGHFDGSANPGFTGLHAAAPLFFDIVRMLEGRGWLNQPARPQPSPIPLNLIRLPVCASTGDTDVSLCAKGVQTSPGATPGIVPTWFIPGVSPIRPSGILQELLIDPQTGLRLCPEHAQKAIRVVWECWPADIRRQFRQAGILKPPPPQFAAQCRKEELRPAGTAPLITHPAEGVLYTLSLSAPRAIPLLADTAPGVDAVYWFAGTAFLGCSSPEEPLLWTPPPGHTLIRALDSEGRMGTRMLTVEQIP